MLMKDLLLMLMPKRKNKKDLFALLFWTSFLPCHVHMSGLLLMNSVTNFYFALHLLTFDMEKRE